MEVSPAQSHPASQQGGRGRWKPGWRSLGEDGGWRFLDISFILLSYKSVWGDYLQESESYFHTVIWFHSLVSCGLAVSTMYHSSAELDRRRYLHESESFVPNLESVDFSLGFCQCLRRAWCRKYLLWRRSKFTNVVVPFLAVTDKQTNIRRDTIRQSLSWWKQTKPLVFCLIILVCFHF